MKRTITLFTLCAALLICSCGRSAMMSDSVIDLSSTEKFGILTLEQFSALPDKDGDLKSFDVILPEFDKLVYYGCDTRFPGVAPNNKSMMWVLDSDFKMLNAPNMSVHSKSIKGAYTQATEDGTITYIKLKDGSFLALLPLVGEETMARFDYVDGKSPVLTLFSWGTKPIESVQAPVLAYAKGRNLYEANYNLWSKVLKSGLKSISGSLRTEKDYPEFFNYLGWCSWEEYKSNISEAVITEAVKKIESSDVPVRWILIDDGTQSAQTKSQLDSFEPSKKKFPNGFKPVTALRNEEGVKWMGVWHHQSGYFGGFNRVNDMGEQFNKDTFKEMVDGSYRVQESYDAQKRFLERHLKASVEADFDFVKIDFQSVQFRLYRGNDNAVSTHLKTVLAQEEVCENYGIALLNCMSQDMINTLNNSYGSVKRASQDYHFGIALGATVQTYQCYSNALWIGQTAYPDHDMFHSSDSMCNLMMAYSKAVSAAPVYLSDAPENFAEEFVLPLCYEDGELLKPLTPAAPLEESMFCCPINTANLYHVIAPLANGAASVVSYNLYDDAEADVRGSITPEVYKSASALMQPYKGDWKLPREGLLLYDVTDGKAVEFTSEYEMSLRGIGAKMFNLIPIVDGWAVIGETSKYLSPITVEDIKQSAKRLSFEAKMDGEYVIWRGSGVPMCGGKKCEKVGDKTYKVAAKKGQKVTITVE
ncbi:MAG: Sip1-related alpha-galactosidase [Rikenellaceae bacterium]